MSKSELVPERRTDKNGITSTKWVKPRTSPAQSKAMPAPKVARETVQAKKQRLCTVIETRTPLSIPHRAQLRGQVQTMRGETVDAALNMINEHHDSPRVAIAVKTAVLSFASEKVLLDAIRFAGVESVYDKYMPLVEEKQTDASMLDSDELQNCVLYSIAQRSSNPKTRYSLTLLTEEERAEALTGGYVAAALQMHQRNISGESYWSNSFTYLYQDHGALIGVFEEFPDQKDEMIAYVYENGADAGALRQHMRGDHSALAGGVL